MIFPMLYQLREHHGNGWVAPLHLGKEKGKGKDQSSSSDPKMFEDEASRSHLPRATAKNIEEGQAIGLDYADTRLHRLRDRCGADADPLGSVAETMTDDDQVDLGVSRAYLKSLGRVASKAKQEEGEQARPISSFNAEVARRYSIILGRLLRPSGSNKIPVVFTESPVRDGPFRDCKKVASWVLTDSPPLSVYLYMPHLSLYLFFYTPSPSPSQHRALFLSPSPSPLPPLSPPSLPQVPWK